jgi:hypothetical protein
VKSNAVHTPQQIAVPPTQAEPTGLIQRKCACGGKSAASDICTKCKDQELTGFQPSLLVNKPGDRWERQADRVASQVKLGKGLNENILPVTSANLQRSPTVQETSHLGSSNLGSGRSLSDTTRSQMESQFGHNFSDV